LAPAAPTHPYFICGVIRPGSRRLTPPPFFFAHPGVMSFLRQPKPPEPVTPPNPADTANMVADERRRRLAQGGRNATALTQMASATAPTGRQNTLTGLNG